jgi:hypothetical protein
MKTNPVTRVWWPVRLRVGQHVGEQGEREPGRELPLVEVACAGTPSWAHNWRIGFVHVRVIHFPGTGAPGSHLASAGKAVQAMAWTAGPANRTPKKNDMGASTVDAGIWSPFGDERACRGDQVRHQEVGPCAAAEGPHSYPADGEKALPDEDLGAVLRLHDAADHAAILWVVSGRTGRRRPLPSR